MATVTVPKKGGYVPYPKPEVIRDPEGQKVPVKKPVPQPA